ncbi:MAG: hypothetical protein SVM80_11815 [Halobacteriota archaeon]|nr:hypothetical protein [Halobacteriota archaeon]
MVIATIPHTTAVYGLIIGILSLMSGLGDLAVLLPIPLFALTITQTKIQVWDKLDEFYEIGSSLVGAELLQHPLFGRTVMDFEIGEDIWSIADNWAEETYFRVIESDESRRLYQKGSDIWSIPIMLEIQETEGKIHLETWMRTNPRNPYTFSLPSEMSIESGNGIVMTGQRRIARNAINELLEQLGQPKIT